MLSRDLARTGHYPAVDVLGSISRLRNDIVPAARREPGTRLLRWLKSLEDNRDLVNIGAYRAGSDPRLDAALAHEDAIRAYLTQDRHERAELDVSFDRLAALVGAAGA